jgi:apolipoprotein N-acyltransferase
LGGALMGSATPPIDFYAAAWLGLALLAFTVFEGPCKTWRTGALRGWVFGTAVSLVVLRFVPHTITRFTTLPLPVALLALVLLSMFQGIPWMFAGWLARRLYQRRVPSVIAFGVAVWLSTFVPTVFPWTVAAGLSPVRALVQLADVVGERGVTALLAVSSALLAEAIRAAVQKNHKLVLARCAFAVAIPILLVVYGTRRISAVEHERSTAPRARIALVQPATEARARWDASEGPGIVSRLTMLTKGAEQRGAELVVWPEAAFPYPMQATSRADLFGPWAVLQTGVRGPVLTGVVMTSPSGSYNSAVLVHGGHVDPPYHKMHLLAFGEAVPLASTFPFLRKIFVRGLGMIPGEHQVLLSSGAMHAAVLNCFEDTLPEAGREAAEVDPNLLINLTNDAWFEGTEESELHLRLATMRAVELRRDLVRAVNLGPTSWVDATGRVRKRYDQAIPGSLPVEPALLGGKTIYARFGDVTGALLLALLGLALWLGQKTNGAPETGTPSSS